MKGSIRERPSTAKNPKKGQKVWEIQVYTGKDPLTGKRTRYFETFKGSKPEADRRLRALLVDLDRGQFAAAPGRLTVAEHFQRWLDGYARTNCSQRTHDGYESIIRNHLAPAFGSLKIKELTPPVIQAFYGKACRKWSSRSVHHWHRVLSESLKYAVRQGYLYNNPCSMCDPPQVQKKVMRTLTPDEVERLLEAGKDSYYYPVVYTALSSGLRQAELLALRWRDVDLMLATISVNRSLYKQHGLSIFKEPKTAGSRRRVAMTPKLALFLKDYKEARGYLSAQTGRTLSADDLVFTSIDGDSLSSSSLDRNFKQMAARAGIEGVRFHDLRHTFASLMLLRGASPKVISEALGHSSAAFTMDVYSHIIQGMQESAMALLDSVLPAGAPQHYNGKLTANP